MDRTKFQVVRVCSYCKGTGEGYCLRRCHVCKGGGTALVTLYSHELEGAVLIAYPAPTLDPRDPSMRVAPRLVEGVRREYMTAAEAHEEGTRMLSEGEIVSYVVRGFDDFSKLAESDRMRAVEENGKLLEQRTAARIASDDCPWEDEEFIRCDLRNWGEIERDPVTGEDRLTAKGMARVQGFIIDYKEGDDACAWTGQLLAMAAKRIFLSDRAAQ